MVLFNAFQMTAAFAVAPFLIAWLATAKFPFHEVAFIATACIYLVGFVLMMLCVAESIDKQRAG